MNEDQWVVFVHPFENVERKVKTVMDEVRSLAVVCLGLDSLVYRINSSSSTLGRDCELIEQLFWNIVHCLDFAFSFHFHRLFRALEIMSLPSLYTANSKSTGFNLVEII